MKKTAYILIAMTLLAACTCPHAPSEKDKCAKKADITVQNKGDQPFDTYFRDKTMRLDYFHTGTATDETFSIDRIVSDGSWPGSKTILIDKLQLGLYFFEVIDKATSLMLYSRGFASIFGEWQTIPEAGTSRGTFHESIRFPWPINEVVVILKKRDAQNAFQTIWTTDIDPASRKVNPADIIHTNRTDVILDNGPAQTKVDIVILGDGYTADEMEKFRTDAKRLSDVLLATEPFKSRSSDINIRAVETPAMESGVTKPHPGVFKRTPLSVQYGSFDSERYALSYDNKTIRNVASQVPYEFMVIMMNERTYGGGGIYNLYTTVSSDNKYAGYIMVHEMGHHLAGLADEYYTSSVAYEVPPVTVEPWETNITGLFDKNNLKWKELVEKGTHIPTPWNKEPFDQFGYQIQKERDSLRSAKVPENIMEDLFMRQYNEEDQFFSKEIYKDKVGAFEGAGYLAIGLYRSQLDCIMFTRHMQFCKVCQKSITDVMDMYNH
ncbi:MAG: M64 family metallo-endopeptidase [Bacteroidetes bacterium]|nr:M64 family metallo-endopeptidase [Bacteroidota bacterium]